MNPEQLDEDDMLSCVGQGSMDMGARVAWRLSASATFPARSFIFRLAETGMNFCFVIDKIQSSGHYSFCLELRTMPQLITPVKVIADVVVSNADRTRRLGNQSFKGDFDRENKRFGVSNILLGKTMAQEPSFMFDVNFDIPEIATRSDIPWQEDPAAADVVILSSDGSAPVLVKQSTVLRALPTIMDIVTINSSADESSIDHHSSQSSSSPDSSNIQKTQQAGTSTPGSSPNDDCLVDLSESTVNSVAFFTPSEPNEDDDEALLIGEPIQERPQPAVNRKTRRKQQKRTKLHHHHHDAMAASSVSEEGMSLQVADGSTSVPSPSSSTASSLLLAERFSDTMSSEPSTPKPCPAVLDSPIHKNANKENPLSEFARDGRKVWIWPQDLPVSSCENILRWVYVGVTPWTPLEDFNDMYRLLHRLAHPRLLQAYVTEQRRAIEQHESPLDLIAATDYNVGPAKVLLRPVLLAAIKKRWSSTSTTTALAKMLTEDRSGVLLEFIQSLPVPQC